MTIRKTRHLRAVSIQLAATLALVLAGCGTPVNGDDDGDDDDTTSDVSGNCTPVADGELCAQFSRECGALSAVDNCGVQRTVQECGGCTGEKTCSAGVCADPASSECKSTLSGSVTTRTLELAASPVCVTGDVVIPTGHRLTIEPGVTLDFQGHHAITVKGHLTARGTAAQRITFTSSKHDRWPAISGEDRGWNGLRFYPYAAAAEIDDDWVEYCTFSWANKSGNAETDPVATYVDSCGGAVYLAGRPGSITGPLESTPQRFHFNQNVLHHNAAARSGGGFHLIQEICMAPGEGASCGGGDGYFTVVFQDNRFEENRCNLIGDSYGAGGWSQFHCGLWQHSTITIQGGAFLNNGCDAGSGSNAATQVGGADGGLTLQDVSASPTAGWIWDFNSEIILVGSTPKP